MAPYRVTGWDLALLVVVALLVGAGTYAAIRGPASCRCGCPECPCAAEGRR